MLFALRHQIETGTNSRIGQKNKEQTKMLHISTRDSNDRDASLCNAHR